MEIGEVYQYISRWINFCDKNLFLINLFFFLGGGVGKKHCFLKFFPKFQSALVKTMNMDYAIFMQIENYEICTAEILRFWYLFCFDVFFL